MQTDDRSIVEHHAAPVSLSGLVNSECPNQSQQIDVFVCSAVMIDTNSNECLIYRTIS